MTDKQLLRTASEFRKGLLGNHPSDCMCRVVCYPLCGLLHTMGVDVEILDVEVGGALHAVIELADGRILDPTADQFGIGLPPVYLGKLPDVYQRVSDELED